MPSPAYLWACCINIIECLDIKLCLSNELMVSKISSYLPLININHSSCYIKLLSVSN